MSYHVLIVDDEEIVCRGLAQFVKWQDYGFAVAATAYSADEALSVLERTSYHVLIVDDEEIVCRGLAQFVKWQDYGFAVAATAYSADEALSVLERTTIDVVFMDIRMPGKSGLELLQIIRQTYPHTKSVILSGYADFSYAQEATSADYPSDLSSYKIGNLKRLCRFFLCAGSHPLWSR